MFYLILNYKFSILNLANTLTVILVFFYMQFLTAQEANISLGQRKKELATPPLSTHFSQQVHSFIQKQAPKRKRCALPMPNPRPIIYTYKSLPFFCKMEVKLEKAINLPIKFRLGNVEQVDYLEGKRDSY